jgi:hypothetical protein
MVAFAFLMQEILGTSLAARDIKIKRKETNTTPSANLGKKLPHSAKPILAPE